MRKSSLAAALVSLTLGFAASAVTPSDIAGVGAVATGTLQAVSRPTDAARANDSTDQQTWTPLHKAAAAGDAGTVSQLLDRGAKVNTKAANDLLPIHVAIQHGHVEVVRLLVAKGADIRARDRTRGETPLHYAARFGHSEIARLLVKSGARIDEESRRGTAPIALARLEGHAGVVRALRELGSKYPRYLYEDWLEGAELRENYLQAERSGTHDDLLSFVAAYAGRAIFASSDDRKTPSKDLAGLLRNAARARLAAIELEQAVKSGVRVLLQPRLIGLDEQEAGVGGVERRLREARAVITRGDDAGVTVRFVVDVTWSPLGDRYYGQPCGSFFNRPCQGGQIIATGGHLRGVIRLVTPRWDVALPIDFTQHPTSFVRTPGQPRSELLQQTLSAAAFAERLAHMVAALIAPRVFADQVSTHHKEYWDRVTRGALPAFYRAIYSESYAPRGDWLIAVADRAGGA